MKPSLAVERAAGRSVIDLNTSSSRVLGVVIDCSPPRGPAQSERIRSLWAREPEAEEVATRLGWQVVLVGGACMEDVVVADELNVTHLEDHVQRETLGRLLENLHSLELLWRRRGNEARLNVAAERSNVIRVPVDDEPVVGFALGESEHGASDPSALAIAHLAFTVKVPDRAGQCLGDVRPRCLQLVPDAVSRHDVAVAALERCGEAQEAHEPTAGVGVED